jgi:hypothetical protein
MGPIRPKHPGASVPVGLLHSLEQRVRARLGLRHRAYLQPSRYEITPSPCHSTGRIRLPLPVPSLALGFGYPNF